jgi:hypothetical protein
MFKRIILCIALVAAPFAALAQSVQDQIIGQLTEQGFGEFEISRTFLGRVRVVTQSEQLERELVFNPNTGEILRDYWAPLAGEDVTPQVQLADPSSSSNDTGSEVDAASRPQAGNPPPRPGRPPPPPKDQ